MKIIKKTLLTMIIPMTFVFVFLFTGKFNYQTVLIREEIKRDFGAYVEARNNYIGANRAELYEKFSEIPIEKLMSINVVLTGSFEQGNIYGEINEYFRWADKNGYIPTDRDVLYEKAGIELDKFLTREESLIIKWRVVIFSVSFILFFLFIYCFNYINNKRKLIT